jgi:hypothetical protein
MVSRSPYFLDGSNHIRHCLSDCRRNSGDRNETREARRATGFQQRFCRPASSLGHNFRFARSVHRGPSLERPRSRESALDREASALRMVVLLASSFPGEQEAQIQALVRRHVDEAVYTEWPTMAKQSATLKVASPALAEACNRHSLSYPKPKDKSWHSAKS